MLSRATSGSEEVPDWLRLCMVNKVRKLPPDESATIDLNLTNHRGLFDKLNT